MAFLRTCEVADTMSILTTMSSPATTEPRQDGLAVPKAVGVVVAAVVAALALVSFAVTLTADRLPTGPALDPPPPPTPALGYSASSRKATAGPVSVTMPKDPYACPRSAQPLGSLLTDAVVCDAPVHPGYRGTDTWSATAGFGLLSATRVQPTSTATAQAAFEEIRGTSFADQKTTVTDQVADTVALGGHQVAVVSGEVHYQVAGLPSRYDRLIVIALPTDDEAYAIYFSSRPNDTPKSTLEVLDASISTLGY